jgi:hypothetical protein
MEVSTAPQARIFNEQLTWGRRFSSLHLRPSNWAKSGCAMTLLVALALVALTALMVLAARPKDGESAPFLKSWPVGQAYTLVAMTSAVSGVAMLIFSWPL